MGLSIPACDSATLRVGEGEETEFREKVGNADLNAKQTKSNGDGRRRTNE
jgi:hypothetical protein